MLINIHCAKCIGIDAVPVTVEIDISPGIGIHLVGLADAAVKESLLRTVTALGSLGFRIPGKKIVINLAPADMRKNGSGYDLPIALGIIAASEQMSLPGLGKYIIMGELGLDASVRPIPGALPIAEFAAANGFEGCILPEESAIEASGLPDARIFGVRSLAETLTILEGRTDVHHLLAGAGLRRNPEEKGNSGTPVSGDRKADYMDFADIAGQEGAKRGLEIAAAGGHNVIMVGPPGSGKTSLAKAMIGIMPKMSTREAIETSKIYSVAGLHSPSCGLVWERPFRSPHYSASLAAIIGGGGGENILPGEVSLAQNGILFLDEFAQMPKNVTEALRSPIEDRKVVVSRLRAKVEFPASFMLVAASNPCPCGYYGVKGRCTCTPAQRMGYMSRLSGPIMDRIDIQLTMKPVPADSLVHRTPCEPSRDVAERVAAARKIQELRLEGLGIHVNAEMSGEMVSRFCRLSEACGNLMENLTSNLGLSARAFTRVLKLARTIADMEVSCSECNADGNSDAFEAEIQPKHILEAVSYRFLDRLSPA